MLNNVRLKNRTSLQAKYRQCDIATMILLLKVKERHDFQTFSSYLQFIAYLSGGFLIQ